MAWDFGRRMDLILGQAGATYDKRLYFDVDRGKGQPCGHISEYETHYLFLHGDHSVCVQKNDANVGMLTRVYLRGYEEFEEALKEWEVWKS